MYEVPLFAIVIFNFNLFFIAYTNEFVITIDVIDQAFFQVTHISPRPELDSIDIAKDKIMKVMERKLSLVFKYTHFSTI